MAIRVRTGRPASSSSNEVGPKTPLGVWQGQFTRLRLPKIYNLRSDPFEEGPESINYADWLMERVFLLLPAQAIVAEFLETFKEFPPRAKAASFTVGDVMEGIQAEHNVNG